MLDYAGWLADTGSSPSSLCTKQRKVEKISFVYNLLKFSRVECGGGQVIDRCNGDDLSRLG